MSIIEFDHVTKVYRKGFTARKVRAVTDLSFTVDENRIVGFVGPNGAGKTTSLKMLLGLVRPTSGIITVGGGRAPSPESRRGIAALSEQPYFYDHLTVLESLQFAYRLNGPVGSSMKGRIDRVLAKVELSDAAGKKVRELSKGMQQRLNMAQALLGDAQLYVLDEPMSGLDPPGRALFRRIFRELAGGGKSIFFSTHILDDIEQLCDGVVVLSKGRLAYQGRITDLMERGFLGTDLVVSLLPPQLEERLRCAGCEVSRPYPGAHQVFVPKGKDAREFQRLLYEQGSYCDTIRARHESLETLLYGS